MGYENELLYTLTKLKDIRNLNVFYEVHKDDTISISIVDIKTDKLIIATEEVLKLSNTLHVNNMIKRLDALYRKLLFSSIFHISKEGTKFTLTHCRLGKQISFYNEKLFNLFCEYLKNCINSSYYHNEENDFNLLITELFYSRTVKYKVVDYLKENFPPTRYYKATKYNKRVKFLSTFITSYILFNQGTIREFDLRLKNYSDSNIEEVIYKIIKRENIEFYI